MRYVKTNFDQYFNKMIFCNDMFNGILLLIISQAPRSRQPCANGDWLCQWERAIFTARCDASAVLAMTLCLSVRPSVCLSVTSRCSTKTAKRRITQIPPHDRRWTLVYCCQRSPRNSTGVIPYEGAECRWGGSKSATFDK